MQTILFAVILAMLASSVWGAAGGAYPPSSLDLRQASSSYNETSFPDACLQECVSIGHDLAKCGTDEACRCTDVNAARLANCMNCLISDIDTTEDPTAVRRAQATLDQFYNECAHASDTLSVTFSLTATGTPHGTAMRNPPTDVPIPNNQPVSTTSSATQRVLRGAIAGGVIGGLTLICLSLWWYFMHRNKPTRRSSLSAFMAKERPFYQLEEPAIPMDTKTVEENSGNV